MTLNPDLVFGSIALGDVKYKLTTEWIRADLYQAVTFAAGHGARKVAIISFSETSLDPETITIGPVSVTHFRWYAHDSVLPEEACTRLGTQLRAWLES
jgi:hypothetical protein